MTGIKLKKIGLFTYEELISNHDKINYDGSADKSLYITESSNESVGAEVCNSYTDKSGKVSELNTVMTTSSQTDTIRQLWKGTFVARIWI